MCNEREVLISVFEFLHDIEPFEDDIWQFEKHEDGRCIEFRVYDKERNRMGWLRRCARGLVFSYGGWEVIEDFLGEMM